MMLKSHSHGKAQVRLLKVNRSSPRHEVFEVTVDIMLESTADRSYTDGDNSDVVPTGSYEAASVGQGDQGVSADDSDVLLINLIRYFVQCFILSNLFDSAIAVYALAKQYPSVNVLEEFGVKIVEHFLQTYSMVLSAHVSLSQTPWNRANVEDKEHFHGFVRSTQSPVHFCSLSKSRTGDLAIKSGVRNFIVLKTTQSGFTGYVKDKYTSLQATKERILSTNITGTWTYSSLPKEVTSVNTSVLKILSDVFFGDSERGVYSSGVQATLFKMADAVLKRFPEIAEIHLHMPNIHYFPAPALSSLGEKFDDDVYLPTSEPFGVIEATVKRTDWSPKSRL